MNQAPQWFPALFLLPATLPFVLMAARRQPNVRESMSVIYGLINLLICYSAWSHFQQAGPSELILLQNLLFGVPLSFRLDSLTLILLFTTGLLWPLATIYSAGYLRGLNDQHQTRFFCWFGIAIAATNGVAIAGNLLVLYLFYEFLSLSTYPLVAHNQDEEARSGSRRYLTFILGGSIGLALPAMIALYTFTGSLAFGTGSAALTDFRNPESILILCLAFLFGFSKAAVMPMHPWLPGAMVAPTPVSSLLHAVAVVKVGVFSVIRALVDAVGPGLLDASRADYAVTTFCAITVFVSAAMMISQDNIKRCLAFSTIGQLSYILLSISFLTQQGFTGGSLHIAMHGFGKITLFFCAGAIAVHANKKYISELDGLGRSMPWTFGAFTIGCLAIVGLPPTGGFLSKWLIVTGALSAGMPFVAGLILVSSLMKAWAFIPIIFRAFWAPVPDEEVHPEDDASWLMRAPLLLTATGSVFFFFFPDLFLHLAEQFSRTALDQGGLHLW